jgi:hypothetical protein
MSPGLITPEKIDALLAFLPGFEKPNRSFIREWRGGYPIYDDDVDAFFTLASEDCWLDYEYQPAVAGKLLVDDDAIAQADLDTLKTMFTYCVRGERFSDGFRATLLEHGRVQTLLRRLQLLQFSPSFNEYPPEKP